MHRMMPEDTNMTTAMREYLIRQLAFWSEEMLLAIRMHLPYKACEAAKWAVHTANALAR